MTYKEESTMVNYLYNQWLKEEREKEIEDLENEYEKRLDDFFDFDTLGEPRD